jgi:signal transduction histidine kinase
LLGFVVSKFLHVVTLVVLVGSLVANAEAVTEGDASSAPAEKISTRISAQGWWSDASSTAMLEEAEAAPYTPFSDALTRGYGSDTIWIRLRLTATQRAEYRVLRVRLPVIDEIALFDPVERRNGVITPRYSGDRQPINEGDYIGPTLGFFIPSAKTERDIYLRVRTTSTRTIYIQLLSQTEADQADRKNQIMISLYLGMLLMLLVWTAARCFFHPDRLVALFTLRFALAIGQVMFHSGLARLIMSSTQIDVAMQHVIANTVILLSVPVSLLCDLLMLREFEPSSRLWRAALASLTLWLFSPLFVVLDQLSLAMQINNASMIVMSIVFLALVWTGRIWDRNGTHHHGLPNRVLILTCYALILFTGMPAFLSHAGFSGFPSWLIALPVLYTILSGIVFVLIVLAKERARRLMLPKITLQAQLAEQASTYERARREEQERFLDMLAHEIKNPLAAIRILSENLVAQPTKIDKIKGLVNDIDSMIRLCVQSGQLEQGKFERVDVNCDVGGLVAEIQQLSVDPSRLRLDLDAGKYVHTDPRLFKIVLENLIGNAVKYSAAGSTVDVTVRHAMRNIQQGVEIEVRNLPGKAGFPDASKVFDKFYRSPHARSVTGSGLGLYLVLELSRLLGATIEYVPDPQYVRFRLWLPC